MAEEQLKVGDLIRLKGDPTVYEFRGPSFPGVLLRDQSTGEDSLRTGAFEFERVTLQ